MASADFFLLCGYRFKCFLPREAIANPSIYVDAPCYSLSLNPLIFFPDCMQLWIYLYLSVGWLFADYTEGSMSVLFINLYLCSAHIGI